MRMSLKVGLLAAIIACVAFAAAKAQEEKSYLPPTWFKENSESTVTEKAAAPKVKVRGAPRVARAPSRMVHHARPVRHARVVVKQRHVALYRHHHRKVRLVYYRYHPRHYYYPRYAYYRPAFPAFPFGIFSW